MMHIKYRFFVNPLFGILGFLLMLISFPASALAQDTLENDVLFQYVDPLIKVFRSTTVFESYPARSDVARGQHATFQFAIRSNRQLNNLSVSVDSLKSDTGQLNGAKVGYLGYVHIGSMAKRTTPARDRLYSFSKYYPDPILETPPIVLKANQTQPIWITIPIPVDATPGAYKGKVVLTARANEAPIRIERPITIQVYSPVVEDTRLWVTNWWYGAPGAGPAAINYINDGKHVEMFSDRHWELLRSMAGTMADYRQNVARISPLHLARYEVEDGHYSFNFSEFDKMVELFIEEGVIGRIEGGHLGIRSSDGFVHDSEFVVYVPEVHEDTTIFEKQPITDERARSFYRQFIPALVTHLKEKGWFDIYMQHIADEPTEGNADSYLEISKFIKDLAPDLRFVEATLSKSLKEELDVWVPTLDGLDRNYEFFKKRQEAGDEIWFYTCVVPQGGYANRFVELPLIKTRLLHWINFRYGATGYLHWGFNAYYGVDPYDQASRSGFPGGDPWIVYPKEGGVIPSIRLEAMRDGIVDYELLKILEEQHPEEAHELVGEVVKNFDRYNTYVPAFRETRKRLLELLSETFTAKAD